jgi:hypothetical protein
MDDLDTFIDRKEYCSLLVLLALVTGSPGLSVPMVRSFLDGEAVDLQSFLQEAKYPADEDGWGVLAGKIVAVQGGTITASDFRRWLPVVGRFSFRPGLADAAGPPET